MTEQQKKTILIMAGGTGGHVFPALAIAKNLQQHGYAIEWLGTKNGLESRVVPEAGIRITFVNMHGFRHKSWFSKIRMPFELLKSIFQVIQLIRKKSPVLIIGMGGYVTAPGGIAAWLMRVPLIIHEQNAVAGLANQALARLAEKVLEGFPNAFNRQIKTIWTGNPIRNEIERLGQIDKSYSLENTINLLIIGGSQGAERLNRTIPQAIGALTGSRRLSIRHQSGHKGLDITQQNYRHAVDSDQHEIQVTAFIDDMAEAYQWADLIICRAGALTIAELVAVGLPAILIPFPHAVDDHQTKNAEHLRRCGGGIVINEDYLTPDGLAQTLEDLLQSPELLPKMQMALSTLTRKSATEMVVTECLEVCNA